MRAPGLVLLSLFVACGNGESPGGEKAGGAGGTGGRGGAGNASGAGGAGAMAGSSSGGAPGANTVSFSRDVAPIFAAKCNACHYEASPTTLDLTHPFDSTTGLVNRLNTWPMARNPILVVPGKPEQSALIDKVAATDLDHDKDGDPMPFIVEKPTAAEVESVRQWIADGAENDAFFATNVAPLFGNGMSLGAAGGKCSICHSPSSGLLPDLVNPFDPQKGVVGVNAILGGGVRVAPGDPDASRLYQKIGGAPLPAGAGAAMPKEFERLTPDEVQAVRTWILEGALDN